MNLYFTYESRDTLNSFTLFITVKAIAKLNLGHRNKFGIEFYRGYYTVARRYEFYFRVAKQYFTTERSE